MAENGKYKDWINDEGLLKIEGWAQDGLTDKEIAYNIGITQATFYCWLRKYKKFKDAVKNGKEVVDRKTENALLKRALGYEYEETTKTEQNGKEIIKTVTKHIPPDVTAIIFWLKNRKPKQWRDVNKLEIDKPVQIEQSTQIDLSKLTKDEILNITREAFKND